VLRILPRLGAGTLGATAVIALAATAGTVTTASAATTQSPPLRVHLAQRTWKATAAGATLEAPWVTITGGRPGVARSIMGAVQRHEHALLVQFAGEAAGAGDVPVSTVGDVVQGTVARSAHYLTIRLDESVSLGGAHPSNSVHAYVFDVATGREIAVRRLFSKPARADRLIRAAMIAQNPEVRLTAQDVAGLSIVPDRAGRTAPLSCYPLRAGLHCAVDQGGVLGYAAGAFEATVSWTALARA
jgi:hypothetical protein